MILFLYELVRWPCCRSQLKVCLKEKSNCSHGEVFFEETFVSHFWKVSQLSALSKSHKLQLTKTFKAMGFGISLYHDKKNFFLLLKLTEKEMRGW